MKSEKKSLIFSAAMAAFLTTGIAQADLSSEAIFSLLDEDAYPSGSVASAEQHTLSNADKAALEAVFAMGDETSEVNSLRPRVDMASMEVTGEQSYEAKYNFNINQTGFTVIDLNM